MYVANGIAFNLVLMPIFAHIEATAWQISSSFT